MNKQTAAWLLAGVLIGSIVVAIWKERPASGLKSELRVALANNEPLKVAKAESKPEIERASSPRINQEASLPPAIPAPMAPPKGKIDMDRIAVTHTYGRTLDRMNLSPEQREAVESYLIKRLAALREIQAQGLGTTETNKMIAAFQAELDRGISELLGSSNGEKIAKMLRYEGSLGRADSLAALSPQDGYSVDQSLEMARIFGEASKRNPASNAVSPGEVDPTTGLAEYDRQILTEATGVLSSGQLDALAKQFASLRARSVATYQAQQEIKKSLLGGAAQNNQTATPPKN